MQTFIPRPQDPTLYRRLRRRLGLSLRASLYKGLWSDREKRLYINVLELKAVSLILQISRSSVKPNSVGCNRQLNSGSLHKQTRKNPLGGDVCSPVEDHDLCHHYQITLKPDTFTGCLNVMVDLLSRSNPVQSTEWSLHTQVFNRSVVHPSCKSICHLSETQTSTVCVSSPRTKCLEHRCSKHNWSDLTAYVYPPTALLHKVIQNQAVHLPDHCDSSRLARDALVLGPTAALNRDLSSASSHNNSSQTVPQLCSSQQATTSQPQYLVSRSGQLQEQGFSVEVAERIAVPQGSSTRTIYKSTWALFEKWCRKNSVDFSTPSVKEVSDFFVYLYQVLNRLPSTIDGYRMAIVDTLGPAGHNILQAQTLTGYSPVFSGIIPKFQESSKMEPFLSCLLSSLYPSLHTWLSSSSSSPSPLGTCVTEHPPLHTWLRSSSPILHWGHVSLSNPHYIHD